MYTLVSRTFHQLCTFRLYSNNYCISISGKVDKTPEIGQGKRVVLQLTEPYIGSGRRVVFDNFFTSIPLCEELVERNLPCIGTLRKNKREIPVIVQDALKDNSRATGSRLHVYNNDLMMTSYIPKKNKHVIMLSTDPTVIPNGSVAEGESEKVYHKQFLLFLLSFSKKANNPFYHLNPK